MCQTCDVSLIVLRFYCQSFFLFFYYSSFIFPLHFSLYFKTAEEDKVMSKRSVYIEFILNLY